MNALKDQLKKWQAQEFERHVRRYIELSHDPSTPENRVQLKEVADRGMPSGRRGIGISWNVYARRMGLPGVSLTHEQVDTRRKELAA